VTTRARSLDRCRPGDLVVVASVEGNPRRIDRLASMGVLPGIELLVRQTRPVVVVEHEETTLALEREIAGGVLVVDAAQDQLQAAE
jgi:Fe2+ transport system protein FeoA